MNKKSRFIFCCITVMLLVACSEDDIPNLVESSSVSIQNYITTDVIVNELPVVEDVIIPVNLKAQLNNQTAKQDLHVRFAVDESKTQLYRNKYGDAFLLPYTSYNFFKSNCHIREGETLSDDIELYIVRESLLRPYSTYVLPLVIKSVDGEKHDVTPGEVMYLVLKTGKSSIISKNEWKVVDVSHESSGGPARFAIDDNLDTIWSSDIFDSPPYSIEIDFGYAITFSGVTCTPGLLSFAYPTQTQIEFSEDGSTWVDKGTFDLAVAEQQLMDTGISTARYMRFTVLDVAPFAIYTPLSLKEIGLEP
ncbi:DUF1735 domain-containing protein [Flavivirga sp. 57AJ16]|uniref:BT_3987 domain-containing protein n=1 Tax=Flavivirga sp. 57AJ16 TaxID=3025307 RepID=UPI0023658A46|nr:DUF1735 domain-containing protein [Flavivirga sp. 57AJ16]MDD7886791.1 DUF1735 domain-containing protein [Flavivirga sp. 57AJ16]